MGWRFDSKLTDAQRNMLREIMNNPAYRPKSTTTRKRLQTLIDLGYVEKRPRNRHKAWAKLEEKSQPKD